MPKLNFSENRGRSQKYLINLLSAVVVSGINKLSYLEPGHVKVNAIGILLMLRFHGI